MNKKINTYNSTRVDSNIYYFKIKNKNKTKNISFDGGRHEKWESFTEEKIRETRWK